MFLVKSCFLLQKVALWSHILGEWDVETLLRHKDGQKRVDGQIAIDKKADKWGKEKNIYILKNFCNVFT